MAVASSTRTMRPLSSSGRPIAVGSDTKRRTPSSPAGSAGWTRPRAGRACTGAACRDASRGGAGVVASSRRGAGAAAAGAAASDLGGLGRHRSRRRPGRVRRPAARPSRATPRRRQPARRPRPAIPTPSARRTGVARRRRLARSGGVVRRKRLEQLRLDGVRSGRLRRGVGHLFEGGRQSLLAGEAGGASGARGEVPAQARLGLDAHAGPAGQVHDVGLVLPAAHAHHLA